MTGSNDVGSSRELRWLALLQGCGIGFSCSLDRSGCPQEQPDQLGTHAPFFRLAVPGWLTMIGAGLR